MDCTMNEKTKLEKEKERRLLLARAVRGYSPGNAKVEMPVRLYGRVLVATVTLSLQLVCLKLPVAVLSKGGLSKLGLLYPQRGLEQTESDRPYL